MKHLIYFFAICVLTFSIIGPANAQVPNKISYQGLLTTSAGTPVIDGSYNLQFDIYDLPSGGSLKHTEIISGVLVQKGTFSVILHPAYTIFSESLFVEIIAQSGPGISGSITFSPRSELSSAPYAFHSWKADTATYAISAGGGGVNNWSINGNAGTIAGTNFVGTTDAQAFDIRTNNILRTRITTKGQIETYNTGQSVFVGEGAGSNDDLSENQNVFVGHRAGFSNTTGYNNTANGSGSLYFNTSGYNNTATGGSALYTNSTGYENTANGLQTLSSNNTGYRNTANGSFGLYSNTEGHSNTANGVNALFTNTTGNNNTALGNEAGYTNSTGNGNVFLGHQAGYNETGSNKLYIANSSANPPLIYGDFSTGNVGLGTTTPSQKLDVNGNVRITGGVHDGASFGSSGQVLKTDGSNIYWGSGGDGSVTSVGLAMPGQFTVTGSPVTTSGTLTASWNNQSANTVLAGPSSGGSAAPSFRSLVSSDIPSIDASKITSGILPIARGGTNSSTALSNNRIIVSSGNSMIEAPALSNGQLLIGNSGSAPVAANLSPGSGISISNGAGSISISNTGFINGGNSFGTTATIGTNDNNKLEFEINGIGRMWLDVNGRLLVGYYTGDDELDVYGTIDSEYGYQYNDAAPSGQYLRGNGTAFVSSAIQASDLPTISAAGGWTDDGSNVRLTTVTDNVGIGTASPSSKLHIAGNLTTDSYTKLGSDAPAIKMKKLTGTTNASEGGTVAIAHGLTASKIISIVVMVEYLTNNYTHSGNIVSTELEFAWASSSTTIEVYNSATNSGNLLSKPIKILITYEE